MFKEKLGICHYEENYYTEEIIQIQDNAEKPSIKEINKVSNRVSTKKLTKDADNKSIKVVDNVLINELDNKSINELDNSSINKLDNCSINELDNSSSNELDTSSINELDNSSINKETNSNITSWYDTDKFNKILATMDNNNFNHKNEIGKLKFNDLSDLINSLKGNTISEADAKKKINELNEIKKVEIKGKKLIESQRKLLSLFDNLLKTIFNKTLNESNSSTKNETVNESNSSTKNETVNKSNSSTKNESKSDNKSNYESDYERDNEGDNLTNKEENYYKIKKLNNWFKTIDQTKSLEEQIELLKPKKFLYKYWSLKYYNDNEGLNYKIFKTKAAYLLIDLNKKIFAKVYGCNFTVLGEN